MKFYTNVSRFGNNILYRGYENGKRVEERIPFSPPLFVESAKASGKYKSLYGVPVEPIQMGSMSEARDFVAQYKNIPNFTVHGNTNYVSQFLSNRFPYDVKFDPDMVDILYMDIEVASRSVSSPVNPLTLLSGVWVIMKHRKTSLSSRLQMRFRC